MAGRPSPIEIPAVDGALRRRDRIFARAPGAGLSARHVGTTTEIEIVGEIGARADVTVSGFRSKLSQAAGAVKLVINSPGGSAWDGVAIFNSAVAHPGPVAVEIIGVAASAASIVAMAADAGALAIAKNAQVMIHRSWGLTVGNAADHEEQAKVLARIDRAMAETYAARTGQTVDELLEAMAATTWMTAEEARDFGFVDSIIGEEASAARFDLSIYDNTPADLTTGSSRPLIQSRSDLERLLHDAGLSREASRRVAAGGYSTLTGKNDEPEFNAFATQLAEVNAVLAQLRT